MPQLLFLACALVAGYGVGRALLNHLKRILQPMSDALNRLTASVTALIDTVAANNTELSDIAAAVRATAAQPSVNPGDTATLTGLAAAVRATGDAARDALPAVPTEPAPAPEPTAEPAPADAPPSDTTV